MTPSRRRVKAPQRHVRKPRDFGPGSGDAAGMELDEDACYRAFLMRDARLDGRIFGAVRTTGIYCRPVCPARTPRRENISFHPSAAAAQEAGFRPCLRCRPETAPDLGAWNGTSNTVSRAMAMIEQGGLDDGSVDALASRLGVGERQLRRLFRQHLGASPVAVAQTRRVLLARQLIHQTRLPMAEVALASGFGSVRRFNETFQHLYGKPPGTLRRTRTIEASAADGDGATLRLPYRAPYDWDAMLAFLGLRAIPHVERVVDGTYVRTLFVNGEPGVVRVGKGPGHDLEVTLWFTKLQVWPSVIARIRRVFDLAADPDLIGRHLSEDPDLAPLIARRPGLRAPGAWDGFELAVRAVLGQQITVVGARNIAGRLAEAHGRPVDLDAARAFGLTRLFPFAAALAALDPEVLPMPRARGRGLIALAGLAARDPDLFGPRRSLDDAVERLVALPGIGPWTAQYIAMRALREPDAFPSGDLGLQRALADAQGRRPSAADLLARAEPWRPWRAYAASHLWAQDATTEPRTGAAHAA